MPFFQTRIKQRKLRKLVDKKIAEDPENKDHTQKWEKHYIVEKEYTLESASNILIKKYSELTIQFGYIVFFAQAFPLAPFFSILSNFLEIRGVMSMMAFYQKRSPAQGAKGIGAWRNILEVSISQALF